MITEIKLTARRLNLLENMGLTSINDLITYFPRKYEDLRETEINKDLDNNRVVCLGKIVSEVKLNRFKRNLSRIQFLFEVKDKVFTVTIFNRDYLIKLLYMNRLIKIVGKLDYYNQKIVASNIYFDINTKTQVIYKLEEGLKEKEFQSLVNEGIEYYKFKNENLNKLPQDLITKYRLDNKLDSIKMVHFPRTIEDVKRGYRHLKYEELLEFVMTLEINKRKFKEDSEYCKVYDETRLNEFINSLPYKLSNAQSKALNEILNDLKNSNVMYRLLQGDVGSGKTLVAIISLIATYLSNEQGAFMAPTDLLARQHYENILKLVGNEVKIGLLVSSMKENEKRVVKEKLKNGDMDIIVGTHALIQKDIEFKKLGLAVIDEQHRFGVKQRQELKAKGKRVDLLLMSATPIPRTLGHTLYGELDISTMDEFPLGKRQVKTIYIDSNNENKMMNDVDTLLKMGNKIYVVCPLIEGENKSKKSVLNVYNKYSELYSQYGVSYLHGKMNDEEKIKTLDDFAKGKTKVLVSTTVIEVGIDIKDASAIIIYGANNFGLAQLHQLRGRVGRNAKEGYCYLVNDSDDEEAQERLEFMCSCDDGFRISEYDMQRRGIGDIIGTKQSGVSDLKVANIIDDYHILEVARKDCKMIFSNLDKLEYQEYLEFVKSKLSKNMEVIG